MNDTVCILQSNYIPWKGYFDLINDSDFFVFYDDVQYTKNDWRNRNKIQSAGGLSWLTVPTGSDISRLVCEVELNDSWWQQKHWRTLLQCYQRAPHFTTYRDFFEDFYLGKTWSNLSDMNQYLIRHVASNFLGARTTFKDSRDYPCVGQKQIRLLGLLDALSAKRYISGPAAKSYIDPLCFNSAGIELVWKDYAGYPEYPQRFTPFEHGVSILDLLFNVGPDAPWYIWGWREGPLT